MRLRLSAGVIDAGASSLATFLAGFVAARTLSDAEMGAYALVFAAWTLATQLPSQLVFAPVEAWLVRVDPGGRTGHLARNLRVSAPWAALAVVAVLLASFLIPADVPTASALGLAATGAVAAALAPAQDHARQLLHLDGRSWGAAGVSIARVALVGVVLASAMWAGLPATLAPLGSLALADGLCLLVVLVMARTDRAGTAYETRQLLRSGSWLLASAAVPAAAGLVVGAILANSVGADALGVADKARIAAQPVLVLGVGLSAVLRAGSMRAAVDGDRKEADAFNRRYQQLLAGGVGLILLVSVAPGPLNVIALAIPGAFVEPGLAQFSVLAAAANAWVMLRRHEVIALGHTREVAAVEGWSSLVRMPVALAAQALQSWVVPAAFLVGGLARVAGFARVLARRTTPAGG